LARTLARFCSAWVTWAWVPVPAARLAFAAATSWFCWVVSRASWLLAFARVFLAALRLSWALCTASWSFCCCSAVAPWAVWLYWACAEVSCARAVCRLCCAAVASTRANGCPPVTFCPGCTYTWVSTPPLPAKFTPTELALAALPVPVIEALSVPRVTVACRVAAVRACGGSPIER
jgi:hypothetical protein